MIPPRSRRHPNCDWVDVVERSVEQEHRDVGRTGRGYDAPAPCTLFGRSDGIPGKDPHRRCRPPIDASARRKNRISGDEGTGTHPRARVDEHDGGIGTRVGDARHRRAAIHARSKCARKRVDAPAASSNEK